MSQICHTTIKASHRVESALSGLVKATDQNWFTIFKRIWMTYKDSYRFFRKKYITNITSPATGDLLFIEFTNKELAYLAMVDSGAQINVMSDSIAQFCNHTQTSENSIGELSGFNGGTAKVQKWLNIPIQLTNGFSCIIPFAIVKIEKPTIILGLPFLKHIKAKLDFVNNLMETPKGPIILCHVRQQFPSSNSTEFNPQFENIPTSALSNEQREQFLEVIKQFTHLWVNDQRGKVKGMEHSIYLTRKHPIVSKPRTYCKEHVVALEKEIREMLEHKVIRPSASPYSSEVVMVKKKTGDWRMCIDYRKLNEFTVPDRYPLPRIPELLRSVADSTYFIALDLR